MENAKRDSYSQQSKSKVAIVRGKFLNAYEMQFFEPLAQEFALTGFGSLSCYHDTFRFPVVKLPSPMDVPDFPYRLSLINRLIIDSHYLVGLEENLKSFDIVHTAETYFHYTQQALNAKKRGYVKKVIATVLENIPFNNEGIWGRKGFKQKAIHELDFIIALTERTKQVLLIEGADEKKIQVISHFVDTKRFFPDQKQQQIISDQHNKMITLLFCGRLEDYKGVYELLYATKLLILDDQLIEYQFKLLFVGEGSQKHNLQEKSIQMGISNNVLFDKAPYSEMPLIFQQATIYIAPSKCTATYQEQYNTTLLEAQAMGLPIITTASGGIVENVGEAALVVQQGDVYSLKEALKRFVLNPKLRVQFAHKARERAVAVHDITIGAQKIAQVYRQVLS